MKESAFNKEMFEVMVEHVPVSMYILENWQLSYVNDFFCNMIGYTKEELLNGSVALQDFIHPADFPYVETKIIEAIEEPIAYARYRVKFNTKNNKLIHVEIHSTKTTQNGQAVLFGSIFDVTEEVNATIELQESQERFKSLFDNSPEAIFSFDLEGNFTGANLGTQKVSGYSNDELLDMSFIPLIVTEDLGTTVHSFKEAASGNVIRYKIVINRKDGTQRNLEVTNFPIKTNGNITGVFGVANDITAEIEHQKLMEDLVYFDSLTKLPNRKLFEDRLKQVLQWVSSNKYMPAVLILDLDRFKFINDSLGHHLGDELLKAVSERITNQLFKTDTAGRFSGDEFAILVPHSPPEKIIALAKQLNSAIARPYEIQGHTVTVSASIGITFCEGPDETIDELLKKAEIAMYYTKDYGKNGFTVYSEELNPKIADKLMIERDLKSAITNQQLVLHYQPITDIETGNLNAMEALIRWNHPELGLVPPDSFIPISEESGLIFSIGKWVLETACAQNKAWQDAGNPPFIICVNISAMQFQHPDFVETIKTVLLETGLEAKWLELEATESILMKDTQLLKDTFLNLKALGVSISIDDFGTGYTSLSYLRQFSFDRIKIDRSFIGDINSGLNGKAITSIIISLAHKLNMSVVAEGIENETQLAYLKEEKCDKGQGYFFSRPLPAESIKF